MNIAADLDEQLHQFHYENKITWHLIVPYAPNLGGRWESHLKTLKLHSRRTIQKTPLKFEELNAFLITLLITIEGMVNSRPITELSNDLGELSPLTTSHFLIGTSVSATPTYITNEKSVKYNKKLESSTEFTSVFLENMKEQVFVLSPTTSQVGHI